MLAVASIIKWPLIVTGRSMIAPSNYLSDLLSIPGVVAWVVYSFAWGTLIRYAVVLIRRLSKQSGEPPTADAAWQSLALN
jgi:hypothetical protein